MEICRECFQLRGQLIDRHGVERTQRCVCEPDEPRWSAYDYNRALELCRCCGAHTVPSGSRWSLFFCETCHAAVLAHNRVDARAIPIGRHSLMNGIFLVEPVSPATVAATMTALSERIEQLDRWHRERVGEAVRGISGAAQAVPLETYLAHARAQAEESRKS